ncbi:MAG TPA: hypothetical protein VLF71_01970 [Candidatus Saccharimonadales bacterium]|nr:hypothetical protein [Candidatus Saccharimonadales bacterium]
MLIVVWQLGRSDMVLNSLFLFAAVGAVPGTDITLQPDQVFWVLGSLLGLAVLLIFATNLRRGIVALFRRRPVDGLAPAMELAPAVPAPVKAKRLRAAKAPKPKVVVVIKPLRKPGKLRLAVRALAAALGAGTRRAGRFAHARYPHAAAACGRVWRKVSLVVKRAVLFAVRTGARVGAVFARLLRREAIHVAIIIGRAAVRAWAWAEPHLQIFDYWLGVQYHAGLDKLKRHETYKTANYFLKEVNKVIALGRAEVRDVLARVVEK